MTPISRSAAPPVVVPLRSAARLSGLAAVTLVLTLTTSVRAGLHYSAEQYAELPSRLSGFLVDHRSLRSVAAETVADLPPSPLRNDYLQAVARLEKLKKARALTPDEAADLGAVYVRLGRLEQAVGVLLPAARKNPEHFRLVANLGTAFQISGDLDRAAEYLTEAVRLAPDKLREFETWHLALVKLRAAEGRPANAPAVLDNLFGVKYGGEPAKLADAERKKLPDNAVAVVQQLALWLPADGRLLWQLGELANAGGDVRSAAAILEGCVGEFALASPEARKRRQVYRTAADDLAKKPDHEAHKVTLKSKSARPLLKAFDESSLPAVRAEGENPLPWGVLGATTTDARGRPTFLKHLADLDGKSVTLTGFIQPARDEATLTGFLLLEYPVGCWFCETPEATGLVSVSLKAGRATEFKKGLVKVTGTLALNRTDPETYLFSLTDARVGDSD